MSASNIFENDLLKLIFNNEAIDGISTNPTANLHISLHTADPGETGTQISSESAYGSYARVPVARTSLGFTVTANESVNTEELVFPACTGGTSNITHFGIGTAATGAGKLLLYGELRVPLLVSNGITPLFQSGELKATVD